MHGALPKALYTWLFGEGNAMLEVLRGKMSRIKLREHNAEALEATRQADAEDASNALEALA